MITVAYNTVGGPLQSTNQRKESTIVAVLVFVLRYATLRTATTRFTEKKPRVKVNPFGLTTKAKKHSVGEYQIAHY